MDVLDGLEVLQAHHPPDGPGAHELPQLQEVGGVAEDVTDRHDPPCLLRQRQDVPALFLRGRDGLLQEHVVPHAEGRHAGAVVQIVGGGDDDGIGEFRPLEDVLPGDEAVPVGDVMGGGIPLVPDGDGLGHPHDVDLLRIGQGEVPVGVSPGPRPQGDGGDGPLRPVEGVRIR